LFLLHALDKATPLHYIPWLFKMAPSWYCRSNEALWAIG